MKLLKVIFFLLKKQGAVTQLMQGKYTRPIYMEKLQAFYQWYNVYNGLMDNTLVAAEKLDNMMPSKPSSRHWRRPRTLFDPRHELPRLLAWYRDNPRPSRAEMEMYLAELNTTERRRNGHPLQYTSIAIWFKNARAKYRGLGRVSPEPYDRMSPPGMSGYGSDENVNIYEESESDTKEVVEEEEKPKKSTLNGTNKVTLTSSATPVMLTSPKQISSLTSSAFTSYTPSVKVKSTIAPLGLSNMQLAPPRPLIKVEKEAITSTGGLPVQPTPEPATSQVTDIRKIASGFGISLSPADTPDSMPSSVPTQVHIEERRTVPSETVPAAHSLIQANGLPDKPGLVVAHDHDVKKQQDPPPPLQPKKQLAFKNLDLSGNTYKATRKRFNIHPAIEVPKLQAWFAVNPKPDRHSIEQYVAELNSSEFRRNQSKYDSRVVYVWFKNARAKYSRLKQRSPERGDDDSMDQTAELDLSMHSTGSRDSS